MTFLLRHAADTVNVIRSLTAPLLFLSPFCFGLAADLQSILIVLVLFTVIGDMNYILHLHVHRPFSTSRWLNLALDLALGLATGMSASNWRIQHVHGHHRGESYRCCRPHDWEIRRYSIAGALSFATRTILPTFFAPLREAYEKGILRNEKMPLDYRWAFFEQLLLLAAVAGLATVDPRLVLLYVMPWYAAVYFVSRYVDYLNHYGCGGGKYDNANNCLSPSFNWMTQNFGYHTAHHLRPGAHWTELPAIHAAIEEFIPTSHMKRFSWSTPLILYHFYLSLRGRM
jgi:fatty acid desaturase